MNKIVVISLLPFLACQNANNHEGKTVQTSQDSVPKTEVFVTDTGIMNYQNLKESLAPYNGYYSEVEMEGGTLNRSHLPLKVFSAPLDEVEHIHLNHFYALENGFLLLFTVNYGKNARLIISSLDKEYNIVDFKEYPNSVNQSEDQDAIAMTTFNQNSITVLLMHPNQMEEPSFEVNGISKETLTIGNDMKFLRE